MDVSRGRRNAFLAPVGFEDDLKNELQQKTLNSTTAQINGQPEEIKLQRPAHSHSQGHVQDASLGTGSVGKVVPGLSQWGRLFLLERELVAEPVWAQNTWLEPEWIEITSISDAVKKLKERQYLWTYYENETRPHGRAKLIQEKLPKVFSKPVDYKPAQPGSETSEKLQRKLGAFTLISDHLILASSLTTSPFPNGDFQFNENKIDPPSRAYLKLWEWFTLYGKTLTLNDTCLDLGSCPGGWTWVLSSLFKKVISVDKAPLHTSLTGHPKILWIKKDAFQLKQEDVPEVSWVFSDIICEPNRILDLAQYWITASHIKHLVFTVKFKGQTDFATLGQLLNIAGSKARHLVHNKHEVTWWWSRD